MAENHWNRDFQFANLQIPDQGGGVKLPRYEAVFRLSWNLNFRTSTSVVMNQIPDQFSSGEACSGSVPGAENRKKCFRGALFHGFSSKIKNYDILIRKNTIFTTSKKLTWPVIRPLTTKSSPHVGKSSFPEPNGAKMPGFVMFELCEISEVKLLSHLGVNCDYTRGPLEAPDFPDF